MGLYPPESRQPFSQRWPRERVTCPNETEGFECGDEGRYCSVCFDALSYRAPLRSLEAIERAHKRMFDQLYNKYTTHEHGWPKGRF